MKFSKFNDEKLRRSLRCMLALDHAHGTGVAALPQLFLMRRLQ
jgi:hypothetical protein